MEPERTHCRSSVVDTGFDLATAVAVSIASILRFVQEAASCPKYQMKSNLSMKIILETGKMYLKTGGPFAKLNCGKKCTFGCLMGSLLTHVVLKTDLTGSFHGSSRIPNNINPTK